MKRVLLAIIGCTAISISANANANEIQPIEFNLKYVTLILPFQDVHTVYLYDVVNSQNMGGIETPFIRSGKWKGVIGAADVEGGQEALPYVGADVEISEKYLGEKFNLGAWYGYDWDSKEQRGGLKASLKLW